MTKPLLILMCGLSFAGKTTLARTLASHCGWHYLSLDVVNTERGVGLDGNAITPQEWTLTYAEAYRQVQAALRAGRSVVYDETNFLRAQRDQLRDIAALYHAETYVLYVAASEAEARRRWQHNRITRQRGDVRDDDFALVVDRFEPPTADERVIRYNPMVPIDIWIMQTFHML
jgi:predicted kinase